MTQHVHVQLRDLHVACGGMAAYAFIFAAEATALRPFSLVPAKMSSSSTSAGESADNTSPFLSVAAAQQFNSRRVRWWGTGTIFG